MDETVLADGGALVPPNQSSIMPKKKPGESRTAFVARCVPVAMREGLTQSQAVGKCEGMFESGKSLEVYTLESFFSHAEKGLPGHAYKLSDKLAAVDQVPGSQVAIDRTKVCITACWSSNTQDRSRDIVHANGIDLSEHARNPVMLYAHDQESPIGKAADEAFNYTGRIESDKLIGTCYFSQKSRLAAEVFELYAERILSGWSIGFVPTNAKARQLEDGDKDFRMPGYEILALQIVEVSAVACPDNPDALTLALDNHKIREPLLVKSLSKFKIPVKGSVFVPDLAGIIMGAELKLSDEQQKLFDKAVAAAVQDQIAPYLTKMSKAVEAGPRLEDGVDDEITQSTEEDDRPHGAQALTEIHDHFAEVLGHIEEIAGKQENPEVMAALEHCVEQCEGACEHLADAHEKAYPDLEPLRDKSVESGSENTSDDEGGGKVEGEKNARTRLLERLKNRKAKTPLMKGVSLVGKKLNKSHLCTIKEAGEYMGECALESNMTRAQKAAHLFHAKSLGTVVEDHSAINSDEQGGGVVEGEKYRKLEQKFLQLLKSFTSYKARTKLALRASKVGEV